MSKKRTVILSMTVMALWGSLFPCIKIGYEAFNIGSTSVAEILMFAAMRFTVCGFSVTLFCICKRKRLSVPTWRNAVNIVWVGVFAVFLHYACTYDLPLRTAPKRR